MTSATFTKALRVKSALTSDPPVISFTVLKYSSFAGSMGSTLKCASLKEPMTGDLVDDVTEQITTSL